MSEQLFSNSNIVYVYTSEEAVADGILYDLDTILPEYMRSGFVKYITVGIGTLGYIDRDEEGIAIPNIPNITDLLVQAQQIYKRGKQGDWFYSGSIETPNGERQKIFIEENETERFTILLPSEH